MHQRLEEIITTLNLIRQSARGNITKKVQEVTLEYHENGCIISNLKVNPGGYATIGVFNTGYLLHRLVYALYHGNVLAKDQVVRHTCDNPSCINPDHLLVGTTEDNVRDRVNRDRSAKGTTNGRNKISEDIAAMIILDTKSSHNALAKKFGLNKTTIIHIRTGDRWAYLHKRLKENPPTDIPIEPVMLKKGAIVPYDAETMAKFTRARYSTLSPKLTQDQAVAIILNRDNLSLRQLSETFNVSVRTILQIRAGKRWKPAHEIVEKMKAS